jgi:hypothetical protein
MVPSTACKPAHHSTSPANLRTADPRAGRRQAAQLLITVRQDVDLATARREAELSGHAAIGNAEISVPGGRVAAMAWSFRPEWQRISAGPHSAREVNVSDANSQRVQVLRATSPSSASASPCRFLPTDHSDA